MRKRNPWQAIHEAHANGWDVVNDSEEGETPVFVVTHPSNPGEGRDRPYIFDGVYLDSRAGWRAVTRYLRAVS